MNVALPGVPPDHELELRTPRLRLEPVTLAHEQELYDLFSDPELHRFVEMEAPTREQQNERCARWSKRLSPKGDEIWLNWAARDLSSGQMIGSFQSAVRSGGEASVGYLVRRASQGQGYATEAMEAIFRCLRDTFLVRCASASVYSGNASSVRLAEKAGMKQALRIGKAAVFKGQAHDEIVFQKQLVS